MGPRRKCYDLNFKLRVIEFAESHSAVQTASAFNINEKQVREWKKRRDELELSKGQPTGAGGLRRRVKGLQRKIQRVNLPLKKAMKE